MRRTFTRTADEAAQFRADRPLDQRIGWIAITALLIVSLLAAAAYWSPAAGASEQPAKSQASITVSQPKVEDAQKSHTLDGAAATRFDPVPWTPERILGIYCLELALILRYGELNGYVPPSANLVNLGNFIYADRNELSEMTLLQIHSRYYADIGNEVVFDPAVPATSLPIMNHWDPGCAEHMHTDHCALIATTNSQTPWSAPFTMDQLDPEVGCPSAESPSADPLFENDGIVDVILGDGFDVVTGTVWTAIVQAVYLLIVEYVPFPQPL